MSRDQNTSWEKSAERYHDIVGEAGSYYHRRVIFPHLFPLMNLEAKPGISLLDLGCGQGVLSRLLPPELLYFGLDLSPSLIQMAKSLVQPDSRRYFKVQDVSSSFTLNKTNFSHATIILALQNMAHPKVVLANAKRHLKPGGRLFIVLNHPVFRIPKHSAWEIDSKSKVQYRRIDRYLSSLKIPIDMNPATKTKENLTWSFHFSLSTYSQFFLEAGFLIESIHEWASDKVSQGRHKAMEDRARKEIPLFLTFVLRA